MVIGYWCWLLFLVFVGWYCWLLVGVIWLMWLVWFGWCWCWCIFVLSVLYDWLVGCSFIVGWIGVLVLVFVFVGVVVCWELEDWCLNVEIVCCVCIFWLWIVLVCFWLVDSVVRLVGLGGWLCGCVVLVGVWCCCFGWSVGIGVYWFVVGIGVLLLFILG